MSQPEIGWSKYIWIPRSKITLYKSESNKKKVINQPIEINWSKYISKPRKINKIINRSYRRQATRKKPLKEKSADKLTWRDQYGGILWSPMWSKGPAVTESRINRTVILPAAIHLPAECYETRTSVKNTRMPMWCLSMKYLNHFKNEKKVLEVASVKDKLLEKRLGWLGGVIRRGKCHVSHQVTELVV